MNVDRMTTPPGLGGNSTFVQRISHCNHQQDVSTWFALAPSRLPSPLRMSLKEAVACTTVMNRAGSKFSVVGTTERLR